MSRPQALSPRLMPWVAARQRFGLNDVQVQMARELALNPRKLADKVQRHRAFPGQSVAEWIEQQYRARFQRELPELTRSLEAQAEHLRTRKSARQSRRRQRRTEEATSPNRLLDEAPAKPAPTPASPPRRRAKKTSTSRPTPPSRS